MSKEHWRVRSNSIRCEKHQFTSWKYAVCPTCYLEQEIELKIAEWVYADQMDKNGKLQSELEAERAKVKALEAQLEGSKSNLKFKIIMFLEENEFQLTDGYQYYMDDPMEKLVGDWIK